MAHPLKQLYILLEPLIAYANKQKYTHIHHYIYNAFFLSDSTINSAVELSYHDIYDN